MRIVGAYPLYANSTALEALFVLSSHVSSSFRLGQLRSHTFSTADVNGRHGHDLIRSQYAAVGLHILHQ